MFVFFNNLIFLYDTPSRLEKLALIAYNCVCITRGQKILIFKQKGCSSFGFGAQFFVAP